jgi:hypothetical protein
VPVIGKFVAAHKLPDVTVVADADMISEANQFPVSGTEELEPLMDGLGRRVSAAPIFAFRASRLA